MKKPAILISVIVIFTASLFIIYRIYPPNQVNEKKSGTGTASTSATGLTTASSTVLQHPTLAEINVVIIDKSGWQTYTNKQYGFTISAPKDWMITLTNSDGTLLDNNGSLQISPTANSQADIPIDLWASANDKNLSIADWLTAYYPSRGANPENLVKINIPTSDEALAIRSQDVYSPTTYSYLVKKGKLIYEFDPMTWGSDILDGDAQMKAIVETFRFTK